MKKVLGVCVFACLLSCMGTAAWAADLPYNGSNPFIWDNDSESDGFTLAFVMALAHNNKVRLIGISESPNPYHRGAAEDFQAIVNMARASGWRNIPDATWDLGPYYMTSLARPSSGSAVDTAPLNTAPARMIRDQVLAVGTAAKPVVIGTGGALTTVASAYLLARQAGRGDEFASKAVVYAGIGNDGNLALDNYNDHQDSWALYVTMSQLRVVLTHYTHNNSHEPTFMRAFIDTLPNNPIGSYMKRVKAGWFYYPDFFIGDVQPVLALMYPNQGTYFGQYRNVTAAAWLPWPSQLGDSRPNNLNWNAYKQVLQVRDDPSSNDAMIYAYNQWVPNFFCLDELQWAFFH